MITETPIDVSAVTVPDNLADLLVARNRELLYAKVLADRPDATLADLATGWPAATSQPVFTEPEIDIPIAEPEQPAEPIAVPMPEVEPGE
jgi:hypothetical protein